MNHYQQADTLSLDPALAVSGTGGTSAPEQAAANADYSTWPWETVLATVLSIPISDRSEVTGQPWLTIAQGGQPVPGGHLIWSASWNTKPKSGGTSLQVYLNPALYEGGGAWDRFVNAPAQALNGTAGALPLVPRTFQAAQLALAGVTSGFSDMSTNLDKIHHDATANGTPFQGNAATVIGQLFDSLHGATLSIYDQLSNPSYSNAVGAAGDAARAFLGNINSAYTAWSQFAEHSPLGAVVQVLTAIATPDGNGGYTITDPQNTPFGDLTTPGAWDAVEQQAKGLWLGLLTGNSYTFSGLDLLGRSALSTLVGQYATTTGIVKPVVGPAPPPVTQTPVGGPPVTQTPVGGPPVTQTPVGGPQGPGGGPPGADRFQVPGGGPQAAPTFIPGAGAPAPGGPAPGNVPNTALVAAGGGGLPPGTVMPGAGGPAPARFTAAAGTAGGPGGAVPGVIGLPPVAPPGTGQNVEPGARRVSAGLNFSGTTDVLAGAIGATPGRDAGASGPAGAGKEKSKGFTGTVGRPPKDKGHVSVHGAHADKRGAALASGTGAHAHMAPAAGFSLGGGPNGSVLSQSAVSAVAVKPPSITSSTVNLQLTPTSADGGLPGLPGSSAGASALAGPPGGPAAASGMVLADGSPGAVGGGAMLGGQAGQAGASGTMMLPPGAQGGLGQQGQERERVAYMPEDEDYWGTEATLLGPGVDAIDDEAEDEPDFDGSWLPGPGGGVVDDDAEDEPDFDGPRLIVGIGAETAGPNRSKETMSDWRKQ